jgi:hypothetical protein
MNKVEQTKRQITKISKSKKEKKEKKDSSDISSYDSQDDNLTNEDIQKEARDTYMQTELLERITKYLRIDNNIKEKKKELQEYMKAAKKQKDDMEKYIIGYLTEVQEEYIKIDGEGKLTKTVSTRKGAIKVDNIKEAVKKGLMKENINLNEKKFNEVLSSILNIVEDNRPQTKRTYIKRTVPRTANNKDKDKDKVKDKVKNIHNESKKTNKEEQYNSDSEEELPKYK